MANLYGDNYTKVYNTVPAEKYDEGDYAARVRVFSETFTLAAAIADGDIISLFKLTKGCRIVGGHMAITDMGGTGIVKLGITGSDAILHAGLDAGDAAAASVILASGLGTEITAETAVIATCTEITVATTGTVKVTLLVSEA